MWTVLTIIAIIAAGGLLASRFVLRRQTTPKHLRQDPVMRSEHPLPDHPTRPDGSPIPGSEEYRNRQGKP